MISSDSRQTSLSRVIWPLLWAFVFLALIEVALECRAAGRGFKTHLFGQSPQRAKNVAENDLDNDANFGPAQGFPFRSRIVDSRKKQDTIRIWIASSSHAEDVRMKVHDVFPVVIERELNRRGFSCEVLNASRAGMTLEQNGNVLMSLASQWQPDVVIAYQMCNDLRVGFYANERLSEKSVNAKSQGLPKLTEGIQRFVEKTTLYAQLKSNITTRINSSNILRCDVDSSAEELYFHQLNRLQRIAVDANANFFACTFGISHFNSDLPAEYKLFLLKTLPDLKPSAWGGVLQRWNQGIRDRYPEATIDVSAALREQPELFRDPVHFSKAGHEIVGRTIAGQLINRLETLKLAEASAK